MPRLASTHLPALHPDKIIFPFFLCLNSDLLLPEGWQGSQGRGSRSGLGSVVSSPSSQGSSGSPGAPRGVSGPVQLCTKCHPCPQVSHSRAGVSKVRGRRFGLREPLVLQPSCPGVRSCAGTALQTHTEIISPCEPVLWLRALKDQDCRQHEASLDEAASPSWGAGDGR